MWGKEIKFASRLEFHTIGFRDEIGEPCRCFLKSANRNKKKGKRGKKRKEKKKGERGQRCRFCDMSSRIRIWFFFNFCLPDHLLEGRKEGELKHFGSYHVKLDASRHVSEQELTNQ